MEGKYGVKSFKQKQIIMLVKDIFAPSINGSKHVPLHRSVRTNGSFEKGFLV